jgi:CubicO group peptidase (beta-lactamase class C family)
MRAVLSSIFLGVVLSGCQPNQAVQTETSEPSANDSLEIKANELVQQYEALEIFSGVVLMAREGKPFFHKAYGLADRETNRPNTVNTLFDIGSMNKTFTKVVVGQLIGEGMLDMDSKLTDFVSGFTDPQVKNVTVGQLLGHTAGFGDYHDPEFFEAPSSEKTLRKIVERVKDWPLMFSPGEEQEYSNTGYILLGAIIEAVSGKTYFDNVTARIINPLGLEHTYIDSLDQYQNQVANGYYYLPLGELIKNEEVQDLPNPDGGFLSTTEDIMAFYRSYYYDTLLVSEAAKNEDPFFQFLAGLPPGKAPLMAGGFEGFNSALYQVMSDDITIIVFANMDEPVGESVAGGLLAIVRGEDPMPPALPAVQNVRQHYEKHGVAYLKDNFDELTTNFHPEDPKEWILNGLGYAYLYDKEDATTAVELLLLNTELFPESANNWDSLGEAYLEQGDKEKSRAAYEKALLLDPELESAKKMLVKLRGG